VRRKAFAVPPFVVMTRRPPWFGLLPRPLTVPATVTLPASTVSVFEPRTIVPVLVSVTLRGPKSMLQTEPPIVIVPSRVQVVLSQHAGGRSANLQAFATLHA